MAGFCRNGIRSLRDALVAAREPRGSNAAEQEAEGSRLRCRTGTDPGEGDCLGDDGRRLRIEKAVREFTADARPLEEHNGVAQAQGGEPIEPPWPAQARGVRARACGGEHESD